MLENIIGADGLKMEQQITMPNETAIKIAATAIIIFMSYFLIKKYI